MPVLIVHTEDDPAEPHLAQVAKALAVESVAGREFKWQLQALRRRAAAPPADGARQGENSAPVMLCSEAALARLEGHDSAGAGRRDSCQSLKLCGFFDAGSIFERHGVKELNRLHRGLGNCDLVFAADPRGLTAAEMLGARQVAWLGVPVAEPLLISLRSPVPSPDSDALRIAVLPAAEAAFPEPLLPLLLLATSIAEATVTCAASARAREQLLELKLLPTERIVWTSNADAAFTGATCALVGAHSDPFGDALARCLARGVPVVSAGAATLALFLEGAGGGGADLAATRAALRALAHSPARRAAQLERARVVLTERFSPSAVRVRFEAALGM